MKTQLVDLAALLLLAIIACASDGYSASMSQKDEALLALYRESIGALLKSTGPGEKVYVVSDELLPLLRTSSPAIAHHLKSQSEVEKMPPEARAGRLIYEVVIVNVERANDRVRAKASFYVGPENGLVYSVEIEREGSGWKLASFKLFSVS